MGQLAAFTCRCVLLGLFSRTGDGLIAPALTFVMAPVPNSICARCARADELSSEYNSAYVDFGRFLTGMLVVSLQLTAYRSAAVCPLVDNHFRRPAFHYRCFLRTRPSSSLQHAGCRWQAEHWSTAQF